MAFDKARCERLARAMASDTMVYMKDTIDAGLENDIVSNKIQILGSKNSIPAKESPLYRILARPAYR